MTSLRISHILEDGPNEEEQAEKNKEGEEQQGKVFGLDQFLCHQSLPERNLPRGAEDAGKG
jgi:hypothetical protein